LLQLDKGLGASQVLVSGALASLATLLLFTEKVEVG
jgi:hypothetical protein